MKIVIYTQHLKSGGAEKRASIYANYFYEKGVDVCLVTMYKTDKEFFLNPNIPRFCVSDTFEEYQKLGKFGRLKKLKEIFEKIKPEKILSFLPIFSCYAILATKFNKKLKKVKVIHNVVLYQRKYNIFYRLLDAFCCMFADAISLQCYEQLKCNKIFKKKCFVSYNPIEINSNEISRNYKEISAISVGRLTKQKNFKLAIEGTVLAHEQNPNILLDIFGIGPQKSNLQKLIRKKQANDYIHLNDFSFDIKNEYKKHNVIILSSKYEGFTNVLAEGMSSGLVGLSTPCHSGPKEIIQENISGLFFKNKKQLAEKLIRLSQDNSLCESLSENAKKTIKEKFDHKLILDKYLETIENI